MEIYLFTTSISKSFSLILLSETFHIWNNNAIKVNLKVNSKSVVNLKK